MLSNPIAIPEHENFVAAIDKELSAMADAKDKLDLLKEYFWCFSFVKYDC